MDIRNKLSITRLRIKHPLEAKLRGAVLEIQRMIEQGSQLRLIDLRAYKHHLASVADLQRAKDKEPDLIEERTARLAREAVLERVTDARFLDVLLKEDMPFVGGVLRGTWNNAENIVASTV